MNLEKRMQAQIASMKQRVESMEGKPQWEQRQGEIQDAIYMLESLLLNEPTMEQEVQVELTLSVDAKMSKDDIRSRILAHLGQSGGITTMAIEIKEESEIYSDGQ